MAATAGLLIAGGIAVVLGLSVLFLLAGGLLGIGTTHKPMDPHEQQKIRQTAYDRFDKLGLKLPDSTKHEIIELTTQHQKIQAIKVLRDAAGLGLREAKEAVESLTA